MNKPSGLATAVGKRGNILQRLWNNEIFRLALLLVVGKVVVILAVYFTLPSSNLLQGMGAHWDSNYYEIIATKGYGPTAPFVFSPVYPFLIEIANFFLGNAVIAALCVTNLLSFVFPVLLRKVFGFRTALIVELFPTYIVFTTIAYSDVIALIFLAASIMLLTERRLTASSATFSAAILTFFNLAWTLPSFLLMLLRGRRLANLVFYFMPLLAGLAILLWFKLETGQYFSIFQIEKVWEVGFGSPLSQAQYLLCEGASFTCQPWEVQGVFLVPAYWVLRNLFFEAFYIFGAFYLLRTKMEHRVFLFAFSMSVIVPLFFLLGTPAMSIPRLLLPAFPIFSSYSQILKRTRYVAIYAVLCFALAGAISVIQFFAFFS